MIFQARSCLIHLPAVSSFPKQFLHLMQNPSAAKYQYDSNWPCAASAMILFSKLRRASTTSPSWKVRDWRVLWLRKFHLSFLALGLSSWWINSSNCSDVLIKGQRKCTSKISKALAHAVQWQWNVAEIQSQTRWLLAFAASHCQGAGCVYCFLTDRRFSTEAEACELFWSPTIASLQQSAGHEAWLKVL